MSILHFILLFLGLNSLFVAQATLFLLQSFIDFLKALLSCFSWILKRLQGPLSRLFALVGANGRFLAISF